MSTRLLLALRCRFQARFRLVLRPRRRRRSTRHTGTVHHLVALSLLLCLVIVFVSTPASSQEVVLDIFDDTAAVGGDNNGEAKEPPNAASPKNTHAENSTNNVALGVDDNYDNHHSQKPLSELGLEIVNEGVPSANEPPKAVVQNRVEDHGGELVGVGEPNDVLAIDGEDVGVVDDSDSASGEDTAMTAHDVQKPPPPMLANENHGLIAAAVVQQLFDAVAHGSSDGSGSAADKKLSVGGGLPVVRPEEAVLDIDEHRDASAHHQTVEEEEKEEANSGTLDDGIMVGASSSDDTTTLHKSGDDVEDDFNLAVGEATGNESGDNNDTGSRVTGDDASEASDIVAVVDGPGGKGNGTETGDITALDGPHDHVRVLCIPTDDGRYSVLMQSGCDATCGGCQERKTATAPVRCCARDHPRNTCTPP